MLVALTKFDYQDVHTDNLSGQVKFWSEICKMTTTRQLTSKQ